MSTSLFLQSERMDISVGKAKMPAAMLNIFNTLIILILIPIMDRIVYPFLAKIGRSPSHLQRIGTSRVLDKKKHFQLTNVNIFLPIFFMNICFGCSKEPSH